MGQIGHFGPKMAHLHNFGSAIRNCCKSCTMKGANRYMGIILMAFPKKFLFGANGPFRTQNGMSWQLWICSKDWFTVLHNGKGQERHGNYINGFSEKSYLGQFGHIDPKMVHPHNFGSAFRFFLILHNKRVQEEHENFVRYFLRKNLIWGNLIFLGHFLLFEWAWSKFSSQDFLFF